MSRAKSVIAIDSFQLVYPAMFEPNHGPIPLRERTDANTRFRVSALLTREQTASLPGWVYFKEATWGGLPPDTFVVNLTSLYRIPVFGLPDGWIEAARQRNIDPDRAIALARTPARVFVSRSEKTDARTGEISNFSDVIAVQFDSEVALPTLAALIENAGGKP